MKIVGSKLPIRYVGDGRRRIEAMSQDITPGTRPLALTRAQARQFCERCSMTGASSHTGSGGTLWVVKEFCRVNGYSLTIQGEPGYGFSTQIGATLAVLPTKTASAGDSTA